jgi:DNA primase
MGARIPQDFLDQLLSRVDLVELIDARVRLRKAGQNYIACCPFHTEKTASFTVSPVKQFYHCFGCGAHGSAIGFLMAYERLDFPEAVEELARLAGMTLPTRSGAVVAADQRDDLLCWVERADCCFRGWLHEHPARQHAVDYLHRRGLDDDTANAFGLGYAPPGRDSLYRALTAEGASPADLTKAGLVVEHDGGGRFYDRFRDRLMFPIRDRRGRTVAFGGRVLGDGQPKYLNSPETPFFHKGRELYGLYEARQRERRLDRLLVVEGYMDVIALVQHGIGYTVATLGTATTSEHVDRLFRATSEIVFCFDGDRAGREAAWRALENALPSLRDGRQIGFLFLPEGEDPDTLVRKEGRERFERRLQQRQPLSDYLFEQLGQELNLHSLDGRARLAERARPLLSRLPDSVYRDLLLQRLSELTGADRTLLTHRFGLPTLAAIPPPTTAVLTRSPVRRAIALLLHAPDLGREPQLLERLRPLQAPGLALLAELVALVQHNPWIHNTAQILSRYEDGDSSRILQRLAGWQPEYSGEHCRTEFLGVIEQMEKEYDPRRPLFDKIIRGDPLSSEEKALLRDLANTPRGKPPKAP